MDSRARKFPVLRRGRIQAESNASYANNFQGRIYYLWDHSLGEVITSMIEAGLRVEFLHEFPFALRTKFPLMVAGVDEYWRFLPQFSLKAWKPG